MKNQEVNEIQQILIECCNYIGDNGELLGNKCYNCEYWSDTNNVCCSYERRQAEALYNADYRKVDKKAVILTQEEFDKLVAMKKKAKYYYDRSQVYGLQSFYDEDLEDE